MELGHIAGWIAGSVFLASGTLLIGYSLGLRAGTRSSLAKDRRLSAQEQRIARLEKALTVLEVLDRFRSAAATGKGIFEVACVQCL